MIAWAVLPALGGKAWLKGILKCMPSLAAVGGKKKNINAGAKGGSAGLDDYKYDDALDDDDFM